MGSWWSNAQDLFTGVPAGSTDFCARHRRWMPTTSAHHLATWGHRCATGSSRRVRCSPPALPSRTMLRLASARASRLAGPAAPSSHMPLTSDPGLSDVPRARVVDRHHHHHLLRGRRQRSDRLWLDLHRHRALLRAGDRCWRLWSSLGGAVAADPAQQRGGHGRAARTANAVGKSSARLPFFSHTRALHVPPFSLHKNASLRRCSYLWTCSMCV